MSARPAHETASSLARRYFCPGSARMERGMPDVSTEDSTRGDRVHAALAARDVESDAWLACNEEERQCVEILTAKEAAAIAPYYAEHGEPKAIHRETRFTLPPDKFSAQLDVVYVWDAAAVILDYKSGWGDVPDSAENHQLLGQVVAFHGAEPLFSPPLILAGIVQPGEPVELVAYQADQFEAATVEVLRILGETEPANAPLRPGEQQCKYCKAAAVCPALQERAMALAAPVPLEATVIMSGRALGEILEICILADRYTEAVRKEARRRLTTGEPVPGWKLEEGSTRRIVTDAQRALEAVTPLGVTVDAVLGCVTLKVGELEKAVKAATGWKGKDLTQQFNAALESAGCLTFQQNQPSLKRADVPH